MTEQNIKYSLTSLHLPQRKSFTETLQKISFFINDTTFVIAVLILLAWIMNALGASTPLLKLLKVYPFAGVLFIFSGISLLFSAKRHLLTAQGNMRKIQPSWTIWIPMLFAGATAFLGFINFTHIRSILGLSQLQLSSYGGFCFFLIGLSLIPPHTRISHRFHITQSLVFAVIILNLLVILENVYQLLSPLPLYQIIFVPLTTAFIFIFFSFGILCRWANRGFFGNFTLDTVDSILALRLLLIDIIAAPFIGFVILVITLKTSYNVYEVVALVVVLVTVVSILVLWINIKLLYKYDLEYFIMKEALRVHNVDLKLEKERLEGKKTELEQAKQQYLEKLDYQDKFRSVVEKFS